ncbi:metabolite traffic protein EboE [Agarilytica rhodophyticola]|uniref:metabolite traffic protein EboE n=1 Tax=Agarilytica rhodophyticola TaxID=1737490 RepID=UPI000B346C99|nr:metabolite traffic protein EboE [Agarilytica rhodophyticola]
MVCWHPDEIAYCANVHPGISAREIANNLTSITSAVRSNARLNSMYAGLWICEAALHEYRDTALLTDLLNTMQREQLKVVTLNGFPQVNFHQDVVKHKVYQPTWADRRRLDYTIELADVLARCLPEGVDWGTISTLPLAYRSSWTKSQHHQACENLMAYVEAAHKQAQATGKHIRLCLEMEPGCVLETTEQVIDFFTKDLPECADRLGISQDRVKSYLGICYDICHQAVMQENISTSVNAIHEAGITIGKVQVSSALQVDFNLALEHGHDALSSLRTFAEPKYMHQLSTRDRDQVFYFCDDLVDAIDNKDFPRSSSWKIHYHLPIQQHHIMEQGRALPGFTTTRQAIEEFLDSLLTFSYKPHIEVETYTWHVLPEFKHNATEHALIEGLGLERQWLVEQMAKRGLINT